MGLLAWIGIGVHAIGITLLKQRTSQPASAATAQQAHYFPASNLTGFVITALVLLFAVGCVYAAGVGLLGAGARRALARLLG
jgi:hypothetical protein